MKYKTIFFDLDHTLWDYDTNSKETLRELYDQYHLHQRGVVSPEAFNAKFNEVNEGLWSLYDRGLIGSEVIRQQRFKKILEPFQIHDETLIEQLSHDYLYACPRKGAMIPGAIEILDYLTDKYALTLITNGFEEIQSLKLQSGKISHYFVHLVTSQKAGHKKPAREIFDYALDLHQHQAQEAIMIGDNLMTDIAGARNAAVDNVFFNPGKSAHQEEVTHEIGSLHELASIL
jgi:putative hydrolase of the HAD superfamily